MSIYIPHTRRNVRTRSKKDPRRVTISRVKTPSPILTTGILAASAITACADGIVQPVERRALLAFLREWDLLMWMGRNRVLNEFDCRTMHIQSGSPTEPTEAIEDLRVLAGKVQASLVATAAVQVALADGIACKRELRVLGLIRDRLGLANPAISDHRT
ncbi:MAG: tellurite resistance TerB family protein [Acetobacteraceae bacterium]|nr:tellurite resistance TerB family protein [Acetobacteraceae bacterium]